MNLFKKIVVGAMAVSLLVSASYNATPTAKAQTTNESSGDDSISTEFKQMNNLASKSIDVKDSHKIQQFKEMAKNAIDNKQIILNYDNGSLVFDEANILDISEDGKNYTSVTIPIVGDQYSVISNLTLVYDSQNKVINYSETLITKSENNKFVVSSYLDGKLVQEQETDIDYISNTELQKELDSIKNIKKVRPPNNIQPQKSFNEVVLCISVVALVDLTVARIIAATCIASCPAIPPICVACIGAVGVIGAANIGAIVACFQ